MTKEAEMVSLRGSATGINHTIFISPQDRSVKVAINPHSLDPRQGTASISLDDGVVAGKIEPPVLYQVREFMTRNRQVLVDYCGYRIDGDKLLTLLVNP